MNSYRIKTLLGGVVILLLWEYSLRLFDIPVYLFPKVSDIYYAIIESGAQLRVHFLTTLVESVLGLLIACLAALFLSVVFLVSRSVEAAAMPYVIALKTTPVVAIAPILVVWMGNGIESKIIIAAVISFFPILVGALRGYRSATQEAVNMFDVFAASEMQKLRKLYFPTALPYIFAGIKVAVTLSVIGAVVAEFSGANKGLGFYILISSHRLDTPSMFAGVVIVSTLSVSLYYLVSWAERIFCPWSIRSQEIE